MITSMYEGALGNQLFQVAVGTHLALENNEYIDMTDLILKAKDKGLNIDIYPLHESWIDIGKHDDYLKAQRLNFN